MTTKPFSVVAHRGLTENAPGNTMAAFKAAREAGADGVEIDVRLTRDGLPVVHHDWYLNENDADPVPIHTLTADALRAERVRHERVDWSGRHPVPMLAEVLEEFADDLKLEIELKGPEPELVEAVVTQLRRFPRSWATLEITSNMTSILRRVRDVAPRLETALLLGTAPHYMRADVIGYAAVQLARQADARLVHLPRAHLTEQVVDQLRAAALVVHVYPVSDAADVDLIVRSGVPEVVTDDLRQVLAVREERGGPSTADRARP